MARKKVTEERAKPEVVELQVERLKLNENNPRRSKRPNALTASLQRFGFVNPIIGWRRPDGEVQIVSGHQRLAAAKANRRKTVPVLIYPFKDEKEARAFGIADNRLAEVVADWDFDKLRIEFEACGDAEGELPANLPSFGWSEEEWTADLWREVEGEKLAASEPVEGIAPPFGWVESKRKISALVWERFGAVDAYVEPFAGALGVLLGAPAPPKVEVVDDADGCIANFWRSAKFAPADVSRVAATFGRTEVDLVAGWNRLFVKRPELAAELKRDLSFHDPELAGLWLWCVRNWSLGRGDIGKVEARQPNLAKPARGADLERVAHRMRDTVIECGPWRRTLDRVERMRGTVGVFLDPPYYSPDRDSAARGVGYARAGAVVSDGVRLWALTHASERVRVALCENWETFRDKMPASWECVRWKPRALKADGSGYSSEEAVWFSPSCIR